MNPKLEFFYLRKAFFEYKSGFKYFKNRYFLAPQILKTNKVLEQPINHQDLSIHILTCHRDMVMLVWSLASFYKNMNIIGQLYIHSDGSLTNQDKFILNKLFPSSQVIEDQYFLKHHAHQLAEYPLIKKFRTEYPQYFLLKKLIDPYFISDKSYHLIIDSDLIWFKEPQEIEDEIKNNVKNSLIMIGPGIGCPVYFKNGEKLKDDLSYLNSGIVLYQKKHFNLDKLEEYLNQIDINNPKNKHFIEQAGYATCLENLKTLAQDKYIIKGPITDKTIVKHYTSPRRPLFYIDNI